MAAPVLVDDAPVSHLALHTMTEVESFLSRVPSVGWTVFWKLTNCRIEHQDFLGRLGAAGFRYADPGTNSSRVALRRALEWWRNKYYTSLGRGIGSESGDDTSYRIRIVDIATKGNETVFGIVREQKNATKLSVRHKTEARVFVDNASKDLWVTLKDEGTFDANFSEKTLEDQLRPYWEYAQRTLESGDVSQAILTIVSRLDSVRLRPEGGVYFVPATQKDHLEVLKTLVDTLPGTCNLTTLGIPDIAGYKQQAVSSVHDGLMADLAEAESELQVLLNQDSDDVNRERAVSTKMREYRRLRLKVETYADGLGMQTEQAMAKLSELTDKVQALLS